MYRKTRLLNARQGIVLLELLTVMAIIAILAGATVAATYFLKSNSGNVYCISSLKQLGSALREYRIDYGAYPPAARVEMVDAVTGQVTYYPMDYPGGLDVTRLRYAGASENVVQQRLIARPMVCPLDLTMKTGLPANYSTYNFYYNYWGYDAQGSPYPQWWVRNNPTTGNPEFDTTAPRKEHDPPDALPPGIPSWELYPRLANPDAPDTTIVTRCPFHRQSGKDHSHVLRLAGDIITVFDDEWRKFDGIGIPFQYQPDLPGRP